MRRRAFGNMTTYYWDSRSAIARRNAFLYRNEFWWTKWPSCKIWILNHIMSRIVTESETTFLVILVNSELLNCLKCFAKCRLVSAEQRIFWKFRKVRRFLKSNILSANLLSVVCCLSVVEPSQTRKAGFAGKKLIIITPELASKDAH